MRITIPRAPRRCALSQTAADRVSRFYRWDEWVDPSKLATGGSLPTPAQQLGAPPRTKARKAGSGAPGSGSGAAALRTDTEEVRSLKGEVAALTEANAALEERLTALELSGRKGGISVPPAALVASLQLLATAEAELGQDAEVARNLKAQGMTKTVKKKPGLNSAELMVEACLRFSTCMRAQAVENSKAQVALIDTQLQMAREQKAVRTQMVQMQQLIMQGFTTASGLAATAAAAAGPEPAERTVSGNASPARTTTSVGSSVPDESATKIQAAFRGKKEREGLDQTIEQGLVAIESSAVEIQRMWRGKKQRDEIEMQFESEVAALREQHDEHPDADEYAGARHSHLWRKHTLFFGPFSMRVLLWLILVFWLAGLTEDELIAHIEDEAAVRVQAVWRGWRAREDYYDHLDATVAAEQVQAMWRGHKVRKAIDEGDFEYLGLGDEFLEDSLLEDGEGMGVPEEDGQVSLRA